MKLNANVLRVTQLRLLPIPYQKIVEIDQGSPIKKEDDLPAHNWSCQFLK